MRFDTSSQLWVDDNGQPLVVQPPKPTGNDNGFSISSYQDPINLNVSNFANTPLPVTTLDGRQYQPQTFNFQTPDLSLPIQQTPNNLSALDKLRISQSTNANQNLANAGQLFTNQNVNLNSGVPQGNGDPNGLLNIFSNMGQSYSLESSLYGLGSALGKKDYTGMTDQEISRAKSNNAFSAIGNAGKLLLGGTRTFLSGAASSHMNNWLMNDYKAKRRDALVNNQPGVENAYAALGGAPIYQDGGEVLSDDVMSQLQQAVENGDISPEDAQAYMQQIQVSGNPNQEVQETPDVNNIQAQLQQAVQNGEITEEEANGYLQQLQQQPQPQQPQAPQEPQMTPEQAQAQLAQAVQNGEISEEEAQTYLQQLFGQGATPSSQPLEPYTGNVRETIKPEEYLTGEVTTGDENKPYNAEVEKGEYINRDGVTQQVVGDKHSKGGEKMNLQDGTIIISDKKRLGATNAKALSLQTGMKLKAGDTFAQVVDIFNRKIGLEKLNTEQEELFKKLKKVGNLGNQKTQDLNNEFLNTKINSIEEKKKSLLAQREELVKVLFEMQEVDKTPTADTSGDVPQFQDGGEYVLDRYGKDAYQYYLDNWKNDPDYNFRDYVQMRNRLKGFATDYGVALPEGFDRFNEAQMDAFAGQLQKTVPNEVATHYGTYVAPTQSGLQWLVDQNIVSKDNPALKKIIKNGKVTVGSYGSLNKDQQQVIADAVDNLDPTTLNTYATANFRDSKWFYRRPKEETIYYRDKDEFNNVVNNSPKVGDGVFFSGKSGAYFRPRLLQEKTLGSQQEVDDYIKKYGNNPDKVHKDFLSEGDPMVYNLVRAQEAAPADPQNNDLISNVRRKIRRNVFMLPDQSTLPPEALRSVPKYDIRYNYLDNVRLSPEQNLLENYRAYDEARAKMEGLPDAMNQANLAMLAGNVAQANNQAINQINTQNAQMAQQVAQANLQTLNRQAEMDLNLADQYDQRMNRALDITRKDIEGYYDFNRRVNVGEFNTRQQLALLNDLFNNYGINPDGTIAFDPKTVAPYTVNRLEAVRAQQLQEEAKKKRQASSEQTATKRKVSDNWGK